MQRVTAFLFVLTSTVVLLGETRTAEAGPPAGDGWVALFDGKDLSHWKIPQGDNNHWKVVDGVIDYDARSEAKGDKNLWTKQSLGNFSLHLDWRLKKTTGLYPMKIILPDGSYKKDAQGKVISVPTPNADSGVFLRGSSKSQVNIWCWPIGSGEVWGYRNDRSLSAEVRAGVVPKVKADKPVGEWNTFVITLRGDRLTVVLNDSTVLENAQLPKIPPKGPIGLQHHGGFNAKSGKWSPASSLIQFRNVYVKELP
ncbi:MAG: DUF1080 domain-containing protein [Planctomycetales bacterium]